MLRGSKGPLIQIDRLIFDNRNKTDACLINSEALPSTSISNYSLNREDISTESYFIFPSKKLKIIRLTMDDLKNEKTIYNNKDQQLSSSLILEKKIEQKNEEIFSPIYESIDERRNSINHIRKESKTYDKQFEILY